MIKLENNILYIETATQTATMENGRFTSLVSKATGKTYLQASGDQVGSSILWMNGDVRRLDTGKVEVHLLHDNRAEVVFHSWYGDGVTQVWTDEKTGDILVKPGASSGRVGIKEVQWEIPGIDMSLKALIPTCQGVKLPMDDVLIAGSRFDWPYNWEMGLCIFESDKGDGFWVHCRDTSYTYKDLIFGKDDTLGCVTLGTQAYGPLDNNKSAGGVTWRINCFEGGWRVPAKIYKDWYWAAYDLEAQKAKRPEWMSEITMAVCWARADVKYLEALAKHVDPKKVLIHLATWRDFGYDQDYPEYVPSAAGAEYLAYGRKLGFHIAPHMNSIAIDPSHKVYKMLSDMQTIILDNKTVEGWGWDGPNWKFLGVPWTEFAKTDPGNRDYNIMAMIHAGSTMWQSELYKRIQALADNNGIDTCFIDQTLCTYNLHNALVEGRTSSEGMKDLIGLLSEIHNNMAVGGEGRNEITAQTQAFGQMHLFRSTHHSCEGMERIGGDCAIGDFVLNDLCRIVGYHALAGKDDNELLRAKIYDDHNTIPTIIPYTVEEVEKPNAFFKSVFERANA